MSQLIASGHIAGLILLFTLLELLGLALMRRNWNFGPSPLKMLPSIAAGDFLLLAWWFSAVHWAWSAAMLAGALMAHSFDVVGRLANELDDPVNAKSSSRGSGKKLV